jgi:hypothetical protein
MTDTLPPIALSTEQAQAIPEPTRNAARATYAQHYDAAEIERVFGAAASPQQAPAAPTPSAANTAAGHILVQERIAAFQKLRAAGVDDATLQKAAAEEGIAWSDVAKDASAAPAEPMTLQDANERLAQGSDFDAPAQSADDFHFTFDRQHIEGLAPDEVRDIRDMWANALHEAAVPLNLGQSIVAEAMTAADLYEGMAPAQAQLKYAEEGGKLRRMGNVNTITANAEYAWQRLPAGFKEIATKHRLFHTADAYNALANAGAMMKARDGRKK